MNRSRPAFRALLILLLFNSHFVYSQNILWAKKGISEGFENGNAITADDSGNVYAGGQMEFLSVFDEDTLYSNGSHDILVAKYNTDGSIQWIRSFGGRGGDVSNGIAIDAAHNVYVAGEDEDTVDFAPGIRIISAGSNDIFLAKLDAGGNPVWAKRWGNTGNEKALSVATSPAGDSYMTGYFSPSVNFGGTTLNSTGGRDMFVVKVNSSGVVQWAKRAGGNGDDKAEGIAIDQNENVYVVGSFTHSATFSGTTITNNGNYSGFVAKYNSNGVIQWAKAAGDCCDTTEYKGVSVDDNGNVFITGFFKSSTDIGTNHFNSSGSSDAIFAEYDSNGDVVWARKGGGSDEDVGYGISVDSINNIVYATGNVGAAGNFDALNYTFVGFKDIFVVAYDMQGNILWNKTSGGFHRDIGSAITTDKNGYIYTTGLFNGEAFFDSYTLEGYPNQPWADFYVDKISIQPATPPTVDASNLTITPVNCSDLELSFTQGNGTARLIIAHAGSAVTEDPADGDAYSGDNNFGDGTDLGNDNFVVYNGTGNSVTVTGLDPGTDYYFSIVEFNGFGASSSYENNSPLIGHMATPTFSISVTGLQNAICEGDSLILQVSGGTSYTWSPSTGLSSTTSANVVAKPTTTTDYSIDAENASGCHATSLFTLTVNPLPVAHFADYPDVCLNDPSFALTTGTPAGGSYSGPGVSGGQFNPQVAGTGAFTLLYTYTDANGCVDDNTAAITVNTIPQFTLGSDTVICANGSVLLDAGVGFSSYEWSDGSSSSSLSVDSAGTGLGTAIVFAKVENSSGCFNSDSVNVTFDLCAGISDPLSSQINIFPNPFSNDFSFYSEKTISYSIYDESGRLLEAKEHLKGEISAGASLVPGFYLIEIRQGQKKEVFSVVKSK